MKITTILLPVMFLVSCIIALILMTQFSVTGGDWDTINGWLILLIPSLIGIIVGLYILFSRR
jgi:hypothetical protein